MSSSENQKKLAKCPICSDHAIAEYSPFCSRGCKDRDLLKWLGEGYRLPGEPVHPDILPDEDDY